jgi:metallo-beta-lactamase family protein
MKLGFLGAAGEVTGSCFLVEMQTARFIVDCGMFQGGRDAYQKNFAPFAFDPRTLDFVLLTHAHIDHSGLLPRLIAAGFEGRIFATGATTDLLHVMLLDSAHIQERDAEWRRRNPRHDRHARHTELPPLYTTREAEHCFTHLRAVDYDEAITPCAGVRCCWRDAGHILGAAILEVWVEERGTTRKIVFSGDLGQPGQPVMRDPTPIVDADYVLVESTYGDRLHRSLPATIEELTFAINDTLVRRRGNIIVPAFAVGRTQELLFLLGDLYRQGALPDMHIYVDSPLATRATEITLKHRALLDRHSNEILTAMLAHNGKPRVVFVEDVAESMALNRIRSGALIIAASGMCDAGRIKHHLAHNLSRKECSIVFTGFQAQGTLGRRIVDGAASVRVLGEDQPVRAEIHTIGGLSAHADQAGLLGWLRNFRRPPRATYVVHGEPAATAVFGNAIRAELGWNVMTPATHSTVEI